MSEEIIEEKKEENVVKYETHKRLLDQTKKTQAANAELQEKLDEFKKAESEREQKELEEQGKFQEALKLKSEELENERSKRQGMEADIMRAHKKNAFINKLGSNVKKEEYLDFVNFDEITLDESGIVDDATLETKVNWFRQEHGSLIETKGKDLPRDNGAPSGPELSYLDELKAMKKDGNLTRKKLDALMKKHDRL